MRGLAHDHAPHSSNVGATLLVVFLSTVLATRWFLRPERVIVWVNAAYVLVAAITLLFIARQARIMREQATDARKAAADATKVAQASLNAVERQVINMRRQAIWLKVSARATRLNANAALESAKVALLNTKLLIGSERPWIMVTAEREGKNTFHFKAVNVGRTPANITVNYGHPLLVRRNRTEPVPDFEKTEGLLSTPPCLVPSTASCTALRCNIEDLHQNDSVEDFLKYVGQGLFEIWFYGRILYFDTLEPEPRTRHETRWFFWYLPFQDAVPIPHPRHPEWNTYS